MKSKNIRNGILIGIIIVSLLGIGFWMMFPEAVNNVEDEIALAFISCAVAWTVLEGIRRYQEKRNHE